MVSNSGSQHFIVTSQGLAATRWLCFAIALHEDVFVAHGHHSLDSVTSGSFTKEKNINDTNSLTLGTQLQDFYYRQQLHEVFEMYHAVMPNAKAYGCVHSYTLEKLMEIAANSKEGITGINIINLIRHPVSYIASHCALINSARSKRMPIYFNHYEKVMFKQAIEKYPELVLFDNLGSDEFIDFAVSCLSINNQGKDFAYSQFKHIQMEKITTNVAELKELSEFLTGLQYPLSKLESFINEGAINKHRNQADKTPEGIYASWATWKQDIAHMMIDSEVLEAFAQNGYDVSMLRMRSNDQKILERELENKLSIAKEERFKFYVQQPQAELWRSQFNLHQKQIELDDTKFQLKQMQLQIQQMQAELDAGYPDPILVEDFGKYNIIAWQGKYYGLPKELGAVDIMADDLSALKGVFIDISIERLKQLIQNYLDLIAEIERSHGEIERSHAQIQEMESSKFWKLRSAWLRLKETIKLIKK
jgi:hypothetical protein